MTYLASAEQGVPILPDEMDRDGWLFRRANGTIDLRTGNLKPHDPADLITQLLSGRVRRIREVSALG